MDHKSASSDQRGWHWHVGLAPDNLGSQLSLLWAALMFFYISGDYFGLYVPGQLKVVLEGQAPIGPVVLGNLAIISILTVLAGLMVFLSIVLPPPPVNRWLNFAMGCSDTLTVLTTLILFQN